MCTCTVESHSTRHPIVVSVCYLHAPESQLLQLHTVHDHIMVATTVSPPKSAWPQLPVSNKQWARHRATKLLLLQEG